MKKTGCPPNHIKINDECKKIVLEPSLSPDNDWMPTAGKMVKTSSGEDIPRSMNNPEYGIKYWGAVKKLVKQSAHGDKGKENICLELFIRQPKMDFLHEVAGCGPRFQRMVRQSDGFWLGEAHGDLGYNHFVGPDPSPSVLERNLLLFNTLSDKSKAYLNSILGPAFQGVG